MSHCCCCRRWRRTLWRRTIWHEPPFDPVMMMALLI
jgi:hypothetical protein